MQFLQNVNIFKYYICLCLFLLVILAFSGSASPQEEDIRPSLKSFDRLKISSNAYFFVPENIHANVIFWCKTYAFYRSFEGVIHDAEDLSIVYRELSLSQFLTEAGKAGEIKLNEKKADKYVKEQKKEVENILLSIIQKKMKNLDSSEEEMLGLFKKPSIARLKRAYYYIRFQRGLRDRFMEGIITSGKYMDRIKYIFKDYGLPHDLIAVAFVESSFNMKAYSHSNAAGVWQFIEATGKQYLKINSWCDQRYDPLKASEAAAKLLKRNYEHLKKWPLAIGAYNYGLGGMKRAVKATGTRDIGVIIAKYKGKRYKFASRNFYPEFLAAREVFGNYQNYFGELKLQKPLIFKEIALPKTMTIKKMRQKLSLTRKDMFSLNPALKERKLSDYRKLPKGYRLRVPSFLTISAEFTPPKQPSRISPPSKKCYQVKKGDSLIKISRTFRVSVKMIMELNKITDSNLIRVGQLLRLSEKKQFCP